ncbi:heavy metal translocating P-type ATPase [Methanimicrococcus blatticola]|uniref:Copper/silver-translocating P-type ATPase n=1 Tax=Methanimicrococcus blatticola TaxID=91560 RepID=A0A484F6R1_9EURY|nr:cation-translocating P-type ATPase [Methanimicrococcus blatticola]MBZ3935063.1 cation-translocating P-type ATPase [Methanimicrococcus blatticola]MCC2508840.1 cation-translocating P-type ATPase [Methanimicrococcus blatticola]TDQ71133.1 copper/silver-translocating P-type ATPase [Methanimicrococcus blatticola]
MSVMKKLFDLLSGTTMTILGGVFLIPSLYLLLTGTEFLIDPAWVTVIICGFPLIYLAITRLIWQRWISSALLICIAMVASVYIGEVFAAGEVAFIMAIGAILEEKTVERSKKGIKKLIHLAPTQGRKLVTKNGVAVEEMISAEEIKKGDVLRVLPGETIPVDGEIIFGNTSVDQSIITGESLPVDKNTGDSVFCGTINRFGAIDIRATEVGEDSSLQKLIRLVQEAENNQAPMQRIVDKWATWLVPIALGIAVAAYLWTDELVRAVTVLVVFCPCALVLATPTSIIAAIGQATKHGVIIKSGEALENMGKVDSIAFDKTGTLTNGDLAVSDIVSFDTSFSETDLLIMTAAAESLSEHPLGKAVTAHAQNSNHILPDVSDFSMVPGKGIRSAVEGKTVLCGNAGFMEENGISIDSAVHAELDILRSEGKASVLVAADGRIVGVVALSDTLREAAKEMVNELKEMNTNVVLLTGDHKQTADYFASKVGISEVHAELLPADKVSEIQKMKDAGHIVCMIGDGVNDAPALKTAVVGVSMGSMGSDIAIEASDIALMGDDIEKIPYLKRLSNATIRTIKFNITLSMIINAVAIYLSVAGYLTPVTGALVHNVGSVLVVLNAALLYDRNFEKKKGKVKTEAMPAGNSKTVSTTLPTKCGCFSNQSKD